MTRYIVFRRDGAFGDPVTESWAWIGEADGRSARAAIIAALNDKNEEGEFVAVPKRSFRPVSVKVETKTALRFS